MPNSKPESTPTIYLKLAKTCRNIGELDFAISICEKGINKFTTDALLYNTNGENHILKFNKTKDPEDLKLALKYFETSLYINPHNYLAKLLASQIYIRGRAYKNAKKKILSILKTAPDDPSALKLLEKLNSKENLKTQKQERTEKPLSPEIETEKLPIEETSEIDYKSLIKHLPVLKKINGILALFLTDKYGMLIKSINKSQFEANLLSAISANIFRSSMSGSEKMGLGNFKKGIFMTPIGNFFLINVSDAILSILTPIETNQKEVNGIISNYLNLVTN